MSIQRDESVQVIQAMYTSEPKDFELKVDDKHGGIRFLIKDATHQQFLKDLLQDIFPKDRLVKGVTEEDRLAYVTLVSPTDQEKDFLQKIGLIDDTNRKDFIAETEVENPQRQESIKVIKAMHSELKDFELKTDSGHRGIRFQFIKKDSHEPDASDQRFLNDLLRDVLPKDRLVKGVTDKDHLPYVTLKATTSKDLDVLQDMELLNARSRRLFEDWLKKTTHLAPG